MCGMPRTLPTCRKRATFLSISLICQLLGRTGRQGGGRREAVGVAGCSGEVAPPYQAAMAAAVDSSFPFPRLVVVLFPLPLSLSPSPFRLFVSRKSLKLILIFDLCQTNLGARHQTAPNRANYINFHIVSCFDTHSERKKPKKAKEKKSKPNRKKSFCQTNEIRKSIILKPPKVGGPPPFLPLPSSWAH